MCSAKQFAILLVFPLIASMASAGEGNLKVFNVLEVGLPMDSHEDLSAPEDYCEVITRLTLDSAGNVSEVLIVESNPPGRCDEQAVKNAQESRFPESGPGYQVLIVRISNR
jgi:hypothetical protein